MTGSTAFSASVRANLSQNNEGGCGAELIDGVALKLLCHVYSNHGIPIGIPTRNTIQGMLLSVHTGVPCKLQAVGSLNTLVLRCVLQM